MLDKPIALKAVQITALAPRLKEGVLLHRLAVTGLLTRDLASDLGCQDLVFLENGSPKQGFSKFDLDVECGAFRATFEADPDLKQRFELTGDSCEGFVVKLFNVKYFSRATTFIVPFLSRGRSRSRAVWNVGTR